MFGTVFVRDSGMGYIWNLNCELIKILCQYFLSSVRFIMGHQRAGVGYVCVCVHSDDDAMKLDS